MVPGKTLLVFFFCIFAFLGVNAESFVLPSLRRSHHLSTRRPHFGATDADDATTTTSKSTKISTTLISSPSTPLPTTMRGGSSSSSSSSSSSPSEKLLATLSTNYFLCGMISSIFLAFCFPHSGMLLSPFLSKFGVTFVFLLTGLTLKTEAIKEAFFSDWKLNALIQTLSFVAWPICTLGLIGFLKRFVLDFSGSRELSLLMDGIFVTAALPTTVNMCVILTADSNGNVASSLANAVLGNALGIFLTPLLILLRMNKKAAIDVQATFIKLASKVILPVFVGQLLRKSARVKHLATTHKKKCKQVRRNWGRYMNLGSLQRRRSQFLTTPHTQHNTTQHNTTQHNTTQHNTTQHNTTQHNTTQHNTT